MPEFTSDWFSWRTPTWEKMLHPYRDRPVHCLEIGSYEGRSAVWTLQNVCCHPESTLTCVDIWPNSEIERRFDANLAAPAGKVIKKKGLSWKILRSLPYDHYHFVYIDGSHEGLNVLEDAVLAFRLAGPQALICFDDYKWQGPHRHHFPRPAIDAFLKLWEGEVEMLEKAYQVWVRKLN
jgi:predicted O-methyltransferase YrrM